MSFLLLCLGVVVLSVVTADFLMVTIGSRASRSLSDRIARTAFAALRVADRLPVVRVLRAASGAVVLVCVAAFWIVGTWLGWVLIYASGDAITVEGQGAAPGPFDVVAHVGHLLSTLGGATTQPADTRWNVVGALVGLNGMILLTLSVSFLLTTRATLQQGRTFAALVATGPPEVEANVERLADLVSGLHASPFALYYGHRRRDRRLPDMLARFAAQAEDADRECRDRVRALCADLPHLDDRADGTFAARIAEWAAAHRLDARDDGQEAPDGDAGRRRA